MVYEVAACIRSSKRTVSYLCHNSRWAGVTFPQSDNSSSFAQQFNMRVFQDNIFGAKDNVHIRVIQNSAEAMPWRTHLRELAVTSSHKHKIILGGGFCMGEFSTFCCNNF